MEMLKAYKDIVRSESSKSKVSSSKGTPAKTPCLTPEFQPSWGSGDSDGLSEQPGEGKKQKCQP
eukprot:7880210-Alexandrium_andersonii.AAC.1